MEDAEICYRKCSLKYFQQMPLARQWCIRRPDQADIVHTCINNPEENKRFNESRHRFIRMGSSERRNRPSIVQAKQIRVKCIRILPESVTHCFNLYASNVIRHKEIPNA